MKERLVGHLQFNTTKGNVVEDSSGYANNGILQDGAIVVNFPKSKCGNAAYVYCGDILFHGDTFQAKPREGVTVAAFINLKDIEGSRSVFDTIGISHQCGQFHFEVNYGSVRWFHRNETQHIIFSVTAEGKQVPKGMWLAHYVFSFQHNIAPLGRVSFLRHHFSWQPLQTNIVAIRVKSKILHFGPN